MHRDARLGGDPLAERDDRQRARKGRAAASGVDHADRHVQPEPLRAPRQEIRIGKQVERRQRELIAPLPCGERDIRTDPCRLAERQRQRRGSWRSLYRISISAWLRSSFRNFLDSA